ncbi:hypothetical protein BC829DRAFT_396664 [Chytridium lagenaria]|nr:hypothetical protein BC829DRAFT_396664 [Chytridium lagenaria]
MVVLLLFFVIGSCCFLLWLPRISSFVFVLFFLLFSSYLVIAASPISPYPTKLTHWLPL